MGAGRMVIGLATVATVAVILKKNKGRIWMWMLEKKKRITAISYEAVTISKQKQKKMKDPRKTKKIKDNKRKKRIKQKVKVLPSTIKEMLNKKKKDKELQLYRPLLLHPQLVNLARQSPSNIARTKFVDPQQAHKEWRQMHSEIRRVFGRYRSSSPEFLGEILSDLWPDILSRLPLKSIARFRCVCKQWRSLTYNAAFHELHRKRALERKPHTIFVPQIVSTLGDLPVYESGPADGQITEYSPPLVLMHHFDYWISNPVNGLVVAYLISGASVYNYYLVNPATREQSSLPSGKLEPGTVGCRVGFGFDASSGKYKLVRLLPRDGSHYCSYEILTVGTQKWRFIGETPYGVSHTYSQCVFLNGAIYWMGLHPELGTACVLAFDMKHEKFQRISSFLPLPRGVLLNRFSLHQFGGQFFLAESPRLLDQPFLRIWALKVDGESHEWEEEYNVNMSRHSNKLGESRIHLLDIKDGKLMMQQSPSIYSYDLRSRDLQEIYPLGGFYKVGHLYSMSESLISPKSLVDTSAW